ncbi:MAG: peptidyl-prolyl cis-trans isomerase [Desulfobacterales bacterium]|nr:peptidyl-prolyl cis-trans isomerase [Desulfobacterales bacterium]
MRYFVFSFLCLFFLLTWPACSSKTGSSQGVVIRVGDRLITAGDIEGIVNTTSLENGIPKRAVWSSINSLVGRIVNDSLILEYGRDTGITLSELELESAIQDIVKDYPESSFEETLLTNCIDYDEWKERLREKLLIKKIVKKQAESLAPISYQAIKSYYQERKEDFRHPPRAKLMHIVTRTRREAQAVVTRLEGAEDVAKIVKEQSIRSGIQGDSAMNWTTKDMLPHPLSDILFSIPVGKPSSIIETPYGFHIIKVLRREPEGIKGLLEVMGEIENRLLSEAIERHYTAWLSQLRNDYAVTVNYTLLDRIRTSNEGT